MTDVPRPDARTEALIDLADRLASQPVPPPPARRWPTFTLAAVLVVVIGLSLAAIIRDGGDSESAGDTARAAGLDASGDDPARNGVAERSVTAQDDDLTNVATGEPATVETAPPSTVASAPPIPPTAPTTPTTAALAITPTTTLPASTTTVTPAPTSVATTIASNTPVTTNSPVGADIVRWAEFSGGKVYLRGRVPDQATADEVRAKAAAVVGEANVIVEYEIVAGAPRPPSAPLYVRDSVLFARSSARITDQSRGVLDLGVTLMNQNPQITIDILGHTDSDGSEESNQRLSQERVDAIYDYFLSRDIDPNRLTREAFGESRPIADNHTEAGKALNRRVEFTINNLLG